MESVPRNDVDPPFTRESRIFRNMDVELIPEVLDNMFKKDEMTSSSNHPMSCRKMPDHMVKKAKLRENKC